MGEILRANRRWQDLIKQATATHQIFEDLNRIHKTWLDLIKPADTSLVHLQTAASLSLYNMKRRLIITEQLFSGIDLTTLKQKIELPNFNISEHWNTLRDVISSYEKLSDSIKTIREVARLPIFSLSGATREIFTTAYALDAIFVCEDSRADDTEKIQVIAEVKQEICDVRTILQDVAPDLVRPYNGACDAVDSGNTDKTRQFFVSLRELWNHLLRRLAPDDRVKEWLGEDNKELLQNGRPTRRARVLYLCRNLNNDQLTDFVDKDTDAFVEFMELFNRGVHQLNLTLTDEELRVLLIRTDSWLMYILQIWKETT